MNLAEQVTWSSRGWRGWCLRGGYLNDFLSLTYMVRVCHCSELRKKNERNACAPLFSIRLLILRKTVPIFENGSFEILWGKCCLKSEIWEIKLIFAWNEYMYVHWWIIKTTTISISLKKTPLKCFYNQIVCNLPNESNMFCLSTLDM